jgi:hypothetical protein
MKAGAISKRDFNPFILSLRQDAKLQYANQKSVTFINEILAQAILFIAHF